jgi:hypothetical protein
MVATALDQGAGYGVVLGLGIAFALGERLFLNWILDGIISG